MNLDHLEDLLASVEKALAAPVGQRTTDQSLAVAVVTTTSPEYLRELIRLRDGINEIVAHMEDLSALGGESPAYDRGYDRATQAFKRRFRALLDGKAKG